MKPITVIETQEYKTQASKLLPPATNDAIIDYIARNPEAGALVAGTGGVRKLRWATDKGKSGGVRVIYYFHSEDKPIFLFTVYAKSARDNISKAGRNSLKKVVAKIFDSY
jgi:hypothetical protein